MRLKTKQQTNTPSSSLNDLVVLYQQSDLVDAVVENMISNAKQNFVLSRHPYQISQMKSTTYKNGWWKTYVSGSDGKRKEFVRKTKDELLSVLFDFYVKKESTTLEVAFDLLREYKTKELNRTYHTVYEEDTRIFALLSETLKKRPIKQITESDIRQWIVNDLLPSKPTERDLVRVLQVLNQTFEHCINMGRCDSNPVSRITIEPYSKDCRQSGRDPEQTEFSVEERDTLRRDAIQKADNPRALMLLLASYTGLRSGEMPPLLWSDISEDEIHVHKQQVIDRSSGHQEFAEVHYTKNERTKPRGGRKVFITQEVRTVLELAKKLEGQSQYVFHDEHGNPVKRDSYMQFLRRTCKRLGITISHNHAFRVARNTDLYEKNLTAPERATYLGHTTETNERDYSPINQKKLDSIKQKLA